MPHRIGRPGVTTQLTIVVASVPREPTPKSNQWKPLIYAKNAAKNIGHQKVAVSGGSAVVRAL